MNLIVGNWKMNKTPSEALEYINEFKPLVDEIKQTETVIAAPFIYLPMLKKECSKTNIKLAAQNIFYEIEGAFTGEISGKMIKPFAEYVIIGHSERRKYFNETDDIINKKINSTLVSNLKVILCVGESLQHRKDKKTTAFVNMQIKNALKDVKKIDNIVIAYEPIWAIGTGKTASAKQAEEVHFFIRKIIEKMYGIKVARELRIIYGGSVNHLNAKKLINMPNINGLLAGGASLDPISFSKIINSAK